MQNSAKRTIWIDLENSPHVPFFKPIINELERRDFTVIVTSRDAYQTRDLANFHNLQHTCIGKHSGKIKLFKISGILLRVLRLVFYVRRYRPVLAISHGSRSQLISSRILKIRTILIFDYEHTNNIPLIKPSYRIVPKLLDSLKYTDSIPTFTYNGIKEDVYVPLFKPKNELRTVLGYSEDKIIVTVRPPATEAHYHVADSTELFHQSIEFLASRDNLVIIILPRSERQRRFIERKWAALIKKSSLIIPDQVVNGLELIWSSDLVISGGGTMNREAAALGVPVYSIFRGKVGAVDAYLNRQGKLFFITDPSDLKKINFVKRDKSLKISNNNTAMEEIINHVVNCA